MVRRIPPLNALRAFEAAARLGSFARAADELSVTPAAISHQIKGLEAILGVALFQRLPRGLRLTDAGTDYLPDLTRGFDALARAADRLDGDELRGPLHVSTLGSLAHCWLVPRLGGLRARHPDLAVRISTTSRLVDLHGEGIDLAVRYGRGVYPGMRSIKIMEEYVMPVASPQLAAGDPPLRDWSDLARQVLLHDATTDENELWLHWASWLRRYGMQDGVDLARGIGFDNSATVVEAALRGLGVALGRSALVGEHLSAGRLVTLFAARQRAEYAYFAVMPEESVNRPRVRAFVDWLQGEAARDVAAAN